jgi:soluble lytic murein transglycosylase-like protein
MSIEKYASQIAAAATQHGIDAKLGAAVVQHESNGNPFAIGDGGRAVGLMQMHLEAAQDLHMSDEWAKLHAAVITEEEESAVTLALDLGFAYLARMIGLFKGDIAWALAAYNQGPTVITAAHNYAMAVQAILAAP